MLIHIGKAKAQSVVALSTLEAEYNYIDAIKPITSRVAQ